MLHTPEAQIFVRFALRWAVFNDIIFFKFPIGYNVKIKLLIILNELKISKRTFYVNYHQESVARVWLQKV